MSTEANLTIIWFFLTNKRNKNNVKQAGYLRDVEIPKNANDIMDDNEIEYIIIAAIK